jgi:uncharacterized protein (TIRG00374 family)
MRKLLIALVLLFALYFILGRMAEVEQILATLKRGDGRWLALAVIVHLAWLTNFGASFRAIYRALGMEENILRLTILAAAANLMVVVTPSAGMGGAAVFLAEARLRGKPVARVTTAAAMFILYDLIGALIVLALGLIVLFRRNQLASPELIAAGIMLAYALVLGGLLYLGMTAPVRLGNVLAWISLRINFALRPFIHREYLHPARAHEFAEELSQGLMEARRNPVSLLLPIALSLSSKALMITILFLMFLAFKQPFSVGTLIAGFSIGYLFTYVSPTPSGIGFVEGAMTLTLNSLLVPLAAAAVITLAYRAFTVWLTLLYGMAAIRWVGSSPGALGEAE